MGDSLDVLKSFPSGVKSDLGFALDKIQRGEIPPIARRMASIGAGAWELKESDERAWYRVIYLSKIGDSIYVLHSFEKKSRKTDQRDLDKAQERLATVQTLINKGKKDEKLKKNASKK